MIESSSPGEFHPQALTDPDVSLSTHPALIIPSQLSEACLTVWLLPSLVDQRVKLDDPTPSLHPHYGTSSLLRVGVGIEMRGAHSFRWRVTNSCTLSVYAAGS